MTEEKQWKKYSSEDQEEEEQEGGQEENGVDYIDEDMKRLEVRRWQRVAQDREAVSYTHLDVYKRQALNYERQVNNDY